MSQTRVEDLVDDKFATVSWVAEDVQSLRPQWTIEECIDFLERNEEYIEEASMQAGWMAMMSLLPAEQELEGEFTDG